MLKDLCQQVTFYVIICIYLIAKKLHQPKYVNVGSKQAFLLKL